MKLKFTPHGRGELFVSTLLFLGGAGVCAYFARSENVVWLYVVAGALFALWIFVFSFFRDPDRETPGDSRTIVSPADGVVTDVTEFAECPFLKEPAVRVGIFLSVFNCHVNRMPLAGKVVSVDYKHGKMLAAFNPRAETENEQAAVLFENEELGLRFLVKQITGMIARRIVCPCEAGMAYSRGERYGMIKFGSRTELWIPKSVKHEIDAKRGDSVKGGLTVIGRILDRNT
ncbi:MAG: phosphatidylserine decarboxylase [Planctomycetes bacterium]|nr:phosphatidylserine decarboxylase [Planctomycetota bacterium]